MQKKTVIVTGSSRGIGKAIALYFGQQGWNVVANGGHEESTLLQTARELEQEGISCLPVFGDIGEETFVQEMVCQTIEAFGNIHCLVNNAGISHIGLLQDMTLKQWNRLFTTNLTSAFLCCRSVIPYMLQEKQGSILNISSVWGQAGASCEVAYSAAKGGLNAFTKALGKELAPSHIAVNAIACGLIDTRMNQCFSSEELQNIIEDIPAGRMGTCQEVAELAYKITETGDYLTGQVITLDGGWM